MARPRSDVAEKKDFGRRLKQVRVNKGWSQSELARKTAIFLPTKKFPRDNVSKYEKGSTFPAPVHLNAIAKALGVDPAELSPKRGQGLSADMMPNSEMAFRTIDENTIWLRINQALPKETAFKIIELMRRA